VDEKEVNTYEENIEKLSNFLDFDLMQSLIEWVDTEVSIFQFESAFEVNKIEMVLGLRVKDKNRAAEELGRFERQIRRKTPIKFETISYYNHEIRYLALKGFFKVFFGKLFQDFEKPYYSLIDDVVVFADNPNALKTMIKAYVEETTLDYSQTFTKFNERFDEQIPIFTYVNTPVLYETLLSYADFEMRQSLIKNKNYLMSFPQIGVELKTKDVGFESQMKASYIHFEDLEEVEDFETYHFEDIYDWPENEEDAFFVGDLHPSDMEAKQYELFYSNGAIRIKVELKNGELNGDYVSYYPNGKKKIQGKFRKGKQQGLWRYYSAENKILERKRF
ncbi:MAG: toxin-antitoxin system YwqK family antitoxin, partial [Flavobacteriaceae bacterium]